MKRIKLFENWKQFRNYKLILEAVISLDKNLLEILKEIQKETNNPKYKEICTIILNAIGKDYEKNKFDGVGLFSEPGQLSVKKGTKTESIKVGKVIKSLLDSIGYIDYKPDEFQKFIDVLLGKIKSIKPSESTEIKLVSGDDILKYYDKNNTVYERGTELANSCMAGSDKNDLLEIYKSNPNNVQLLVKLIDGKADARALVWKLDYSEKGYEYYMDRCYSNTKSDEVVMFEWLKRNKGKVYKREMDETTREVDTDWNKLLVVKMDKVLFKYYPYLDTMSTLYIKLVDGELVDEGILINIKPDISMDQINLSANSTESGITKNVLDKLGKDYEWLNDSNQFAVFSCRDTRGFREPLLSKDSRFINNRMKILITDYKFKILENDSLSTVHSVIKILMKNPDFTNLFNYQTFEEVKDDYVEYNNMYFKEEDCVEGGYYSGERFMIPRFIALVSYEISELLDKDLKIKVKDNKIISLKKLYEKFYSNRSLNEGKYLTELDCKILGIMDQVDERKKLYTSIDSCLDENYSKHTQILAKLMGLSDDNELIKIRTDFGLMGRKFDLSEEGFSKFLSKLKK